MKCDVIIRTWKPDLPWLSYCLAFLRKNWLERSSGIVIIANEDCRPEITGMKLNSAEVAYFRGERVYYVKPWPDTCNFKCYLALLADEFTDAELVLFLDSDVMLVESASLGDFTEDYLPVIFYQKLRDLTTNERDLWRVKLWPPLMERFLGVSPTREYMARFPILYWTDALASVRRLITGRTARSVRDSLYCDKAFDPNRFTEHPFTFCEFNVLGFWCDLNDAKHYRFKELSEQTPSKIRHYHSYTEWTDKTRKELDSLLLAKR